METNNTTAVSFPVVDGASLTATYNQFAAVPAKARAQYDAVLAGLDWTPDTKPQFDAFIALVSERKTQLNAARTPYTKMFDTIRSNFTGLEAELEALIQLPKAKETAWKTAELQRQREAEAVRNAEAMKVRNLAQFPIKVEELVVEYLATSKAKVLADPTLEIQMTQEAWLQICIAAQNQTGCAGYDATEVGGTIKDQKNRIWETFNGAMGQFTKEVRTATSEELASIKDTAQIEHEQAKENLVQEGQMAAIQAEVTVAEATPTGPAIRTKKVCDPQSLDEVGKVFALWLAEVKPDLSEATKLISKCLTHATKRANDKTNWLELPGVTYREDVK